MGCCQSHKARITVAEQALPAVAPEEAFPYNHPIGENVEAEYLVTDLLGKGSFGSVYLGTHRVSGSTVAVKVMDRSRIKSTSIEREWTVLEHLGKHEHVVEFMGAYANTREVCFTLELMGGGELFDRLVKRGAYSEAEAREPFRQVASALTYLHNRGIIHRDLKPENLLLSDKSLTSDVKIADFGLSQLIKPGQKLTKVCGTWAYAAPEMSDPHAGGYDCRFDTWGYGVILFVVLCGYHPFDPEGGLPVPEIKARARAAVYDFDQPEWASVSPLAKDLVSKLIVKDPAHRLKSVDILKHPWFHSTVPSSPIDMNIGNKISEFQIKYRRKLKASIFGSFFVTSLRTMSVTSMKGRPLLSNDEDEGSRHRDSSASGAGAGVGAGSGLAARKASSSSVASNAQTEEQHLMPSTAKRIMGDQLRPRGSRGSGNMLHSRLPTIKSTGRIDHLDSGDDASGSRPLEMEEPPIRLEAIDDEPDTEQGLMSNSNLSLPVPSNASVSSVTAPPAAGHYSMSGSATMLSPAHPSSPPCVASPEGVAAPSSTTSALPAAGASNRPPPSPARAGAGAGSAVTPVRSLGGGDGGADRSAARSQGRRVGAKPGTDDEADAVVAGVMAGSEYRAAATSLHGVAVAGLTASGSQADVVAGNSSPRVV